MFDKELGTQTRLPRKIDDIGFYVFAMKQPDYKMMLMSTYGKLVVSEGQNENVHMVDVLNANVTDNHKQVHLNYTKIFSNHYKFRGAGDCHNKKRHDDDYVHGIYLENTWSKTR